MSKWWRQCRHLRGGRTKDAVESEAVRLGRAAGRGRRHQLDAAAGQVDAGEAAAGRLLDGALRQRPHPAEHRDLAVQLLQRRNTQSYLWD